MPAASGASPAPSAASRQPIRILRRKPIAIAPERPLARPLVRRQQAQRKVRLAQPVDGLVVGAVDELRPGGIEQHVQHTAELAIERGELRRLAVGAGIQILAGERGLLDEIEVEQRALAQRRADVVALLGEEVPSCGACRISPEIRNGSPPPYLVATRFGCRSARSA